MDELVILGIDPGTISAYAVLTLDGTLIALHSHRNFTPALLLREVSQHGKVITIGSDVATSPGTISKIATQLGARVTTPDHNLTFGEKLKIVDTYLKNQTTFQKIQNKHEKDALACALYAYKRLRPLLKRIDDHLKNENKIHLTEAIRRKVLLEEIPITKALRTL